MAMQMNELFGGRNAPHWLKNDQLELPYDCQEEFEYPTSGLTPPTYEFSVPMCCAKCEEKVREELMEMNGICEIYADQLSKRVIVTGFINPLQALKKMKRIKKKSQFWGTTVNPSHHRGNRSSSTKRNSRHQATVYRASPNQVTYNRQPSRSSSSGFRNNYGSLDDGIAYSNMGLVATANRNTQHGYYDDDIDLRPHTNNNYGSYYGDGAVFNSGLRASVYTQGGYAPELRRPSTSSLLGYMPQSQPLQYTTVPPFAQEYYSEEPLEEYPFYGYY